MMAAGRQIRLDDQEATCRSQQAIGGVQDRTEVLEVLHQEPHDDQIEASVWGVPGEIGQGHSNVRVPTGRDGNEFGRDVDAEITLFRKEFVQARYVVAIATAGVEDAGGVPPSLQRDK